MILEGKRLMQKKILVTGGAGYIGSHVVLLLGEAGFDVTIIDNLSTGRKESILYGKLIEGDLADTDLLDQIFTEGQFDGVMHFAGSIVVPESVENPIKYYENNTRNSLNLLSMCKKHRVENFIFSSTAATYGTTDKEQIDEQTPQDPPSPYGMSKLMTERMLIDYGNVSDFNYVILRYFNVSGADPKGRIGQCFPGATHLIKVTCETALGKRESVSIYGTDYNTYDGTGVRDYIHVMDLAQAHIDGMNYLFKEKKSQIFNCGYGRGYSVRDVINVVREVSGRDFKVHESPRRPGDLAQVISKADKIKDVLGWSPKHNDLYKIIQSAYNWEKTLK